MAIYSRAGVSMSTYEMTQWAGIAAGAVVFIVIVVGIVRMVRSMDAIWPTCAQKLGLTFRSEDGGNGFTSQAHRAQILEGTPHGIPLRLIATWERSGRTTRKGTRVHARSPFPTPHVFSVEIGRSTGAPSFHAVATGDPQFDRIFCLKSDAPQLVRALVHPGVRAAMMGLPLFDFLLSYDRGELCLSYAGTPTTMHELEVPIHVVLASAQARLA
jgi:hypothetical protein